MPIGILSVNGRVVKESLELCDCFILCGGKHIWPFQIEVIDHAVKNGKKLLGICLGHQAVHSYFKTVEEMKRRGYTGDIGDFWQTLEEEGITFLRDVAGHRWEKLPRGHESDTKHKVLVKEGSLLNRITGKTELMGASLHRFAVFDPDPSVAVSALAEDGTIEAIEYGDQISGTQFHPDVDSELNCIFEYLSK
ncbi:MAG: gamma-glutamyl-gamma-aminobutyrate hydrolase family protein [Clostridia bacterium]|nr:gamma-glutamyl-gamma-aminobutyrate hydrolase family protein [Clostridia bacterium]